VKADFEVLKLKFHACNFKQTFYLLHKLYTALPWQHQNSFIKAFRSVSGCQTCMCKCGINGRKLGFSTPLNPTADPINLHKQKWVPVEQYYHHRVTSIGFQENSKATRYNRYAKL